MQEEGGPVVSQDFEQAVAASHSALDSILKGNPDGYKALFSRREDITLGNPFGGFGRGWEEVVEQLERAASYYREGGATDCQMINQVVDGDWAYTVEIERGRVKVGGSTTVSDVAVRVTCIYRLEGGVWKLVHRHADPRVLRQTAESVLER
jgi:ketosteroid isomerase-like protein